MHSHNNSNRSHFSIFVHEYIAFTLLHPFPKSHLSLIPIHQTGPVLSSCSLFSKKELYREFHCDIFMHICIIFPIGSSPILSPFYVSPLLIMISTVLKILYSFLYRKYTSHIGFLQVHLLSFLSH
jgi:hypothetical protein